MRLLTALLLMLPKLAWAQVGPAPFTASGADISTGMTAPLQGVLRSLSSRAAEVFNPMDYGAQGIGKATAIGTTYGANLATLASYKTASGATPFSWAANPAFGLTFSMSTSAASATVKQSFTETLSSSFPTYSATVALWQDPAHGNFALLPGMLLSGSCLAAGTTLAAVQRDPTAVDYGKITLSQAPSTPCSPGTAFTFTIAPVQLQSRTSDWLGWQAAMAQAWMHSGGGHVHAPAGKYIVNGEIINAGGVTDGNGPDYVLNVSGDGVKETQVIAPVDFGPDFALFQEATRGSFLNGRYLSFSNYHDLKLVGPVNSNAVAGNQQAVNGLFPSGTATRGGMDGITVGSNGRIHDVEVSGMRAAFNVLDDHGVIDNVAASNNGYGLYFAPYAAVYGGWPCTLCGLSGNTVASVAVATTNQIDGAHFKNMNTGFGPYSFWLETSTPNIASANGGGISNSVFDHVFVESAGNCFICGPNHNGEISSDIFIGGVSLDVGAYPINRIPGSTPADAIDVANFAGNKMIGTNWGEYGNLSDAMIRVSGSITGNMFEGDEGFVFGATAAAPAFRLTGYNYGYGNTFHTARGDGLFMWNQGGPLAAGSAVTNQSGPAAAVLAPYTDGAPFAGITVAPSGGAAFVGVVNVATRVSPAYGVGVVKADATQPCSAGKAVFATTGGVACGLDQTGAIGTANQDLGATLVIDLDPSNKGGATGSSTITAAGNTQATAAPITSSMTIIGTAAAGSPAPGIVLQPVPVGSCVRVLQRGLNPISVYPPTGSAIEANATNGAVLLSPGSDGQFCRTATTQWMH